MRKLGVGDVYYEKITGRFSDFVTLMAMFSRLGIESELGGDFSSDIERTPYERFEGVRYASVTTGEFTLFVEELYLDGELVGETLHEIYAGREDVIGVVSVRDHNKEKDVTIALYEEAIAKIKLL